MTVYTGRGDEGMTDLRDMSRVSKTSPRIEAYGTVDEANALIGTIRPTGYDDVDDRLERIQNHLHIVQADFATPDPDEDDPAVGEAHVEELEAWIDEADEELEPADVVRSPWRERGRRRPSSRPDGRQACGAPSGRPRRCRPREPCRSRLPEPTLRRTVYVRSSRQRP